MSKEEIVEILDEFICEVGAWEQFKVYVIRQGYTLEELGFEDE